MKKKQFRGRFVKGCVVLTAMILVSLLCACTEKETPEDKALQEAENWVKNKLRIRFMRFAICKAPC